MFWPNWASLGLGALIQKKIHLLDRVNRKERSTYVHFSPSLIPRLVNTPMLRMDITGKACNVSKPLAPRLNYTVSLPRPSQAKLIDLIWAPEHYLKRKYVQTLTVVFFAQGPLSERTPFRPGVHEWRTAPPTPKGLASERPVPLASFLLKPIQRMRGLSNSGN